MNHELFSSKEDGDELTVAEYNNIMFKLESEVREEAEEIEEDAKLLIRSIKLLCETHRIKKKQLSEKISNICQENNVNAEYSYDIINEVYESEKSEEIEMILIEINEKENK